MYFIVSIDDHEQHEVKLHTIWGDKRWKKPEVDKSHEMLDEPSAKASFDECSLIDGDYLWKQGGIRIVTVQFMCSSVPMHQCTATGTMQSNEMMDSIGSLQPLDVESLPSFSTFTSIGEMSEVRLLLLFPIVIIFFIPDGTVFFYFYFARYSDSRIDSLYIVIHNQWIFAKEKVCQLKCCCNLDSIPSQDPYMNYGYLITTMILGLPPNCVFKT